MKADALEKCVTAAEACIEFFHKLSNWLDRFAVNHRCRCARPGSCTGVVRSEPIGCLVLTAAAPIASSRFLPWWSPWRQRYGIAQVCIVPGCSAR